MSDVDELAQELEEPRAVKLLAEWLAISHYQTRLEWEEYREEAQELYEYIVHVIWFPPNKERLDA